MATFTTSCIFTELAPNCGYKDIIITTPSSAVSGDTVRITLVSYGISAIGLLAVDGYTQTTAGSVVAREPPTTAVSEGDLTITSGVGTGTKIFRIMGKSS